MIPCYQICKNNNCQHFDIECFDCKRLPDDCEYAVEHLVSDIEYQVLNGQKHGLWIGFHSNSKKKYEGHFVDGEREGVWREWYKNGQLMMDCTFKNGRREGSWKSWHENGQRFNEGHYVNDERSGVWRRWTVTGELIE